MGEVWKARDTRLRRNVAVKALPDSVNQDPVRLARLEHEAALLAALNHPNIATIHGLERQGGTSFLVMELVEGNTLEERLLLRPLALEEALMLALQLAQALEAAHDKGIIHRDLKPSNIKITNDKRLKVLDFGIATALADPHGDQTRTINPTERGAIVGTPAYMSPEQARGETIGFQSDIWAFGAVLFEMLTGVGAFKRQTSAETFASVLESQPDYSALPPATPAPVRRLVQRCLEKDLSRRLRHVQDVRILLEEAVTSRGSDALSVGAVAPPSRRFVVPALTALTIMAAVVAAWGWLRPSRTMSVVRYPTTLGASGDVDGIAFRLEAALSPDGASLVFRNPLTGPGQLYIKRRDEAIARPLAGTEGGSGPFFSPDGAWIGFFAHGQLRRVPGTGGTSLKLADSVDPALSSGAWLEDGSIFYYDIRSHTIRRLRSGETTSQVIVTPAMLGGRFPWLPVPLPSSRGILFTAHLTECVGPASCRPFRVYVYDSRSNTVRALFEDAIGAWYVPTGHVLYLTSSGTLMAVPWDNAALAAAGTPVPILDGIQAPGFMVSDEGTALYLLGRPEFAPGPAPNATVVWLDRNGHVDPVDSSWQVNTGGTYGGASGNLETGWGLALSPDGQRIAITLLTNLGTDIWIKQLPTGPVSRLTLYAGQDRAPAWTRDGRAISFLSDRPIPPDTGTRAGGFRLWEQTADGTGEPRLLWGRDSANDGFWSPDGRWVVLDATGSAGASAGDILAAQPGVDNLARRMVGTGYDEGGSALSPDSRWLAYVSNEPGKDEVFVRPFPDVNGGKWQVSSGGGSAPVWAHNGRELFYVSGRNMNVVQIHPGVPFSAEPPRVLFAVPDRVRAGSPLRGTFAITPDDQRFLMVRDDSLADIAGTPTMVAVEHFFEELKAKLKK